MFINTALKRDNILHKFFQAFNPSQNNNNKERDFSGFSMFIGHNYENNSEFNDLPFQSYDMKLEELINGQRFILFEETDNYFTPNLFVNKASSKRIKRDLAWLTSLYIDIDGIDKIDDPQVALNKLYDLCDKENIPMPNIVLNTSINPTVHLQVFWLIDPIYVLNNNNYVTWWKKTAQALIEALKTDKAFNIDETASKDPVRFMRVPYSINQKTGQAVEVLDYNIPIDKRLTLRDFNHLIVKQNRSKKTSNTRFNKNHSLDKLLDHPQIKKLLQGVPAGYRNKSQYALAKCCYADGYSVDEGIDIVLEQNSKCSIPENETKVIDVVNRAYGLYGPEAKCFYNLRAEIVAETVNGAFNTTFKPDQFLYTAYRRSINRGPSERVRAKYISKAETIRRIINTVIQLTKKGLKYLPAQKELAKIANVKYSSLRHYFNKYVVQLLKELFNIRVQKVGRNNRIKIYYVQTLQTYKSSFPLENVLLSKSPIETVLSRELFGARLLL